MGPTARRRRLERHADQAAGARVLAFSRHVEEKARSIKSISPVEGKYDTVVDRESAEELRSPLRRSGGQAAAIAKAQVEVDKQEADRQ